MSLPARWSTPATVTAAVQKAWDRGQLLREVARPLLELDSPVDTESDQAAGGVPVFQAVEAGEAGYGHGEGWRLRVLLPGPTRNELADLYTEAGDWARTLRQDAARRGWSLEERDVPSRLLGKQRLPKAACIDNIEQALALLGDDARRLTDQFRTAVTRSVDRREPPEFTRAWFGVLMARPLEIAANPDVWLGLLAVASWLRGEPRPGIWLREIPVPRVHTKLLEQHKSLARTLFDAILPASAVDLDCTDLEGRYGFAAVDLEVQLTGPGVLVGVPWMEQVSVTWPLRALAALTPAAVGVTEVVVVENKTSAQRVPAVPGRLVVWGVGYAAEAIAQTCAWWDRLPVRYWGDVDTHGLRALARVLRQRRTVVPVLMDEATLLAHRHRWGTEEDPADPEVCEQLLPAAQAALLDDLRKGRWRARLRLEQEHLDAEVVAVAFAAKA